MKKVVYRKCSGCNRMFSCLGHHMDHCVWYVSPEKFFSNGDVDTSNEDVCWIWKPSTYSTRADKYGLWGGDRAHRQAWRILTKKDPDELFVLHNCDQMSCVNPSHLYLGSQKQNIQDSYDRNRRQSPMTNPETALKANMNKPRGDDHYTRRFPEIAIQRSQSMHRALRERRGMTND